MADVATTSGAVVSIGPAAAATRATTATAMAALTPYVAIDLVENIGDYGDEAGVVNFTSLGDGRVRKSKGSRDAGDIALTVGNAPADPGQAALIAAELTSTKYAFKIAYNDKVTGAGTGSVDYFYGMVRSKRKTSGGADDVIRRTFNIAIDSPIMEVAAT